MAPCLLASLLAAPMPMPMALATPSVSIAAGAEGGEIAPYHAVYALTLASSTDQGVLAASGSMTDDVADACSGWTTAQHLTIHMTDRDGRDSTMVSDYATFETKDGTRLTFHTRQMTDSEVTASLDGTAWLDRSGGHGHADYTGGDPGRVDLPPGTLLPNAHTLAILRAGHAGKRFLSMPLFDGTSASGAQDTFVTIEGWHPAHTERWSSLSRLQSGRVHVAFFDRDPASEEPDYEIGMRYFDNGVADDLKMNFGDFMMDGKLAELTPGRPPHC